MSDALPRFLELITEAHEATRATDNFDLDGKSAESRVAYRNALTHEAFTLLALLDHVRQNEAVLAFLIGKYTGQKLVGSKKERD